MKILKTDKRLIDEGHRYKIEGDLIIDEALDLTHLRKPLYVTGSIKAAEYIDAGGSIKAAEYVKAGEVNTENSEDIITLNGKKYKLIEG